MKLLLIALFVTFLACAPGQLPNPPPGPDADASGPPVPTSPLPSPAPGTATCDTWCLHAVALGCVAAQSTPGGASCIDVCKNFDGPLALNVACRTNAATCDAADECENAPVVGGAIGPGHREAGAAASTAGTCATWCAHATALKCAAAKPTPAGATCETVCGNTATPLKWNLTCRSSAKTCTAADACEKH